MPLSKSDYEEIGSMIKKIYPKYQIEEYEQVRKLHGRKYADRWFKDKYDIASPSIIRKAVTHSLVRIGKKKFVI